MTSADGAEEVRRLTVSWNAGNEMRSQGDQRWNLDYDFAVDGYADLAGGIRPGLDGARIPMQEARAVGGLILSRLGKQELTEPALLAKLRKRRGKLRLLPRDR